MDYTSIDDDVLERHLFADPNNIHLIMEAARRFGNVSERADVLEGFENRCETAEEERDDANAELAGLRDELAQSEAHAKDLQGELDELHIQLRAIEVERDDLKAEATRLETVLSMIADV